VSGFVEPVTLTGQRWVTLEPLAREHVPEIAAAAADGELGDLWFTSAPKAEATQDWVEARLASQKPEEGLTFVVRSLDGTLIGSSSYLHVDAANRRLEVGNTWYVAAARRSGVNSETKLLMLGHAFNELNCVAVEFALTSSISPAGPRSSDWAPNSTACCAATRCCPMDRAATRWCTRSSTSSGQLCATICDTGWTATARSVSSWQIRGEEDAPPRICRRM
jgi:RimJ/RimL family protein N-acetyltransferase